MFSFRWRLPRMPVSFLSINTVSLAEMARYFFDADAIEAARFTAQFIFMLLLSCYHAYFAFMIVIST